MVPNTRHGAAGRISLRCGLASELQSCRGDDRNIMRRSPAVPVVNRLKRIEVAWSCLISFRSSAAG